MRGGPEGKEGSSLVIGPIEGPRRPRHDELSSTTMLLLASTNVLAN